MSDHSSAANLPPELFPLILQHLAHDHWEHGYSRGKIKHHLFAVSLTCRFWAEKCRPHLFRSLSFRTRTHLYEFSDLLDQAGKNLQNVAPLTTHLQALVFIPCEGDPPWIHLVSPTLRRKIPDRVTIYLGLAATGFVPKTGRTVRSIHHSLPRSLPTSYSQFHSLYLSDVYFRDVVDFVRLISEVRTLRQLHCYRLVWDKSVPSEEIWGHTTQPGHLETVHAEDCTDNWVFLGLVARRSLTVVENTARTRSASRDHVISKHDLMHANEIVQACQRVSGHDSGIGSSSVSITTSWWSSYDGYGKPCWSGNLLSTTDYYTFSDISHTAMGFDDGGTNDASYHPPDIMFSIGLSSPLNLSTLSPRFGSAPSPRFLQSNIVTVVLDLVSSARWCWHPWDSGWDLIATLALQLPHLRRIVLGFVSKSNLEHFAHRPHGVALGRVAVIGSDKLRYAYVQAQGKRGMEVVWVSVNPVTLKNEGAYYEYL